MYFFWYYFIPNYLSAPWGRLSNRTSSLKKEKEEKETNTSQQDMYWNYFLFFVYRIKTFNISKQVCVLWQ